MSRGAYTILDSYIGKQELLLTATAKLEKRLNDIQTQNLKSGKFISANEAKAKLADITQTHNIYVKGVWRPHVAFSFDYFKNSPVNDSSILTMSKTVRIELKGNNGNYIHDMVLHVVLPAVGNANANPFDRNTIKYKYCDLVGLRLIKSVTHKVKDIIIDKYNREDTVFYTKSLCTNDKQAGWFSMVGQETTVKGQYYHADYNVNQTLKFTDGPQTPKPYQPELHLWIPLIFDFNLHLERAFHNEMIKTQEVYLEFELEAIQNILTATDYDGVPIANQVGNTPTKMQLYTKNIYMPQFITDTLSVRSSAALIRVFKHNNVPLTTTNGQVLMSQLKYPIEYLNFGFQLPADEQVNPFQNWHKNCRITNVSVPIPTIINNSCSSFAQLVSRPATYSVEAPIVSHIGFTVSGNVIYPLLPEKFYSRYMHWFFDNIVTPSDVGVYLVSFCHYPTQFNPSGHINNSTAREFYLNYTMPSITIRSPINLYVSAHCINILLYTQGSIELKYIT